MDDQCLSPAVPDAKPSDQEAIFIANDLSASCSHYWLLVREWWRTRSALLGEQTPYWRDRRGAKHALQHTQDMTFTAGMALEFLADQAENRVEQEMLLWVADMLTDLSLRRIPEALTKQIKSRGARPLRKTLLKNLAFADAFVHLVEKGIVPGDKTEATDMVCRMYGIARHIFEYQRKLTRPHHWAEALRARLSKVRPEDLWTNAEQLLQPYANRYRSAYLSDEAKSVVTGGGKKASARQKKG